jgi:ABC-type transporter Mla MlaB component
VAFTIHIIPDHETVMLSAYGHFDLAVGFALWQYCQPEQRRYRHYIVDLAGVNELRDSGLAWLIMFSRWAAARGAGVRLINAYHEIEQRCLAAGITVNDSATCNIDELVRH